MGLSNSIPNAVLQQGVCTSTTRPLNPYVGQTIIETDTDRLLAWDGSVWSDLPVLTKSHGCEVYSSVGQTIASLTTTVLTFNSESVDTDGYHSTSTNTSRITIPSGLGGLYMVTGYVRYDSNVTTTPLLAIQKNSVNVQRASSPSSNYAFVFISAPVLLAAGDYVELVTYHFSGANRDVNAVTPNTFSGIDPRSPFFSAWLISGATS